jgi:glycosyltransferase involved in cell wall biosynthesis
MATYNGEKYLKEQLFSIIEQKVKPKELVIVDDCSSDKTLDILYDLKSISGIEIKIIENKKNIGFRRSFIKGVNNSSYEWICFSDQDDVWEIDKLFQLEKLINKCDSDVKVIFHSFVIHNPNIIKKEYIKNLPLWIKYKKGEFDSWRTIPGMSICFSNSLKEFISFQPFLIDMTDGENEISHDQLIMLFGDLSGSIVEFKSYLINYRRHDRATSNFMMNSRQEGWIKKIDFNLVDRQYIYCKNILKSIKPSFYGFNYEFYEEFVLNYDKKIDIKRGKGVLLRISFLIKNHKCGIYSYFGSKELFKDFLKVFLVKSQE